MRWKRSASSERNISNIMAADRRPRRRIAPALATIVEALGVDPAWDLRQSDSPARLRRAVGGANQHLRGDVDERGTVLQVEGTELKGPPSLLCLTDAASNAASAGGDGACADKAAIHRGTSSEASVRIGLLHSPETTFQTDELTVARFHLRFRRYSPPAGWQSVHGRLLRAVDHQHVDRAFVARA